MPYNTVAEAENSIPAIKDLSLDQKKEFVKIFNRLLKENMKEGEAIPIAISEAKKINKDENVRMSSFTLANKAKGDASSTPAKPSERRSGSDKNPAGSAKDGKGVTFSEKVTQALKNKVKEHNAKKNVKRKVSLSELKAVYRRGAGAFSTSHRPNMTRGQWAMARVNSYLRGGHSQDNDLKKADQYFFEKEEDIQNKLDAIEKCLFEDVEIEKGNASQVTRDSNGNLVYRGIKFAGYGKPRKSDNPKKDRMVLVREGDKVAIVRYGDASMRQNYSVEANDRFYDRFGSRPEAKDKFSATYWALRDLWPRGSLKGRGAKPLTPLKKSEDMGKIEKNSPMQGIKDVLYGLSCMISPNKGYSSEEEEDKSLYGDSDKYGDPYIDHYVYNEEIENYDLDELEDQLDQIEIEESYEDVWKTEDNNVLNIVKQLDDEEMVAIEPLYINAGEADLHGDGISDVELDKMIDNFNKNIYNIKGNIHHAYMTEGFKPVKAYRMPMDVYIGDPSKPSEMTMIKEGQPVVKVQFAKTDMGKYLWEKRKSGKLMGVSIGAKGKRVPNPNYKGYKS